MSRTTNTLEGWPGGGISELADAVGHILDAMGRSDDTLGSGNDLGKRIRVIRDYARRGILSDAERRGKELHYDRRHLGQLVAARLRAAEGVTLSAIASQFRHDPDVVAMTLGTPADQTSALDTWQSMRDRDRSRHTKDEQGATPTTHTYFMRSAGKTRGRRVKLRALLDRLGVHRRYPESRASTRIDVTEWCTVIVDTDKLRALARSDIDDLGRVITESLLNARSGK